MTRMTTADEWDAQEDSVRDLVGRILEVPSDVAAYAVEALRTAKPGPVSLAMVAMPGVRAHLRVWQEAYRYVTRPDERYEIAQRVRAKEGLRRGELWDAVYAVRFLEENGLEELVKMRSVEAASLLIELCCKYGVYVVNGLFKDGRPFAAFDPDGVRRLPALVAVDHVHRL